LNNVRRDADAAKFRVSEESFLGAAFNSNEDLESSVEMFGELRRIRYPVIQITTITMVSVAYESICLVSGGFEEVAPGTKSRNRILGITTWTRIWIPVEVIGANSARSWDARLILCCLRRRIIINFVKR
jgi:hypothetical protein